MTTYKLTLTITHRLSVLIAAKDAQMAKTKLLAVGPPMKLVNKKFLTEALPVTDIQSIEEA